MAYCTVHQLFHKQDRTWLTVKMEEMSTPDRRASLSATHEKTEKGPGPATVTHMSKTYSEGQGSLLAEIQTLHL